MRLLIVSNVFPPRILGGYELACHKIANGLRERGHDVLVVTSPCAETGSEEQSYVERALSLQAYAPEPAGSRAQTYLNMVSQWGNSLILLDALRRFRPDHVMLFNLIGLGGIGLLDTLESVGAPWVLNLGDDVPVTLTNGVPEAVLEVFGAGHGELFSRGRVASVSQGLVDTIQRAGISLGDRVEIIPRGILPGAPERSRPYLDGGVARFVAAGTLNPVKGMELIVAAAALLAERSDTPFTVDIYGRGDAEPFQAQAASLGVADRVAFKGHVDQRSLFAEYAAADAFLFPTWEQEAGASVPFEAAAAGCLPILTSTCGPAERLIDGVNSLKITRDASSLADAMALVASGELDLEAFARAGRRLVEGDLAFSTSIDRVEAMLRAGERPDWADRRLDDPGAAAEIIDKDTAARKLMYADGDAA